MSRYGWTRKAPAILAVLAGVASAVFAWRAVNEKVARATQTVSVVVAARDVEAYTLLDRSVLTYREVPAAAADGFTVQKAEAAVGKVALAPLYKDKPIDMRFLAEPSDDAAGFQVVGVNVDPARAAGVKPGDLVDVYWLTPDQGAWVPGSGATLVARAVRVLKVCDDRGNPLAEGNLLQQAASAGSAAFGKGPSIVYLAVRAEDVPRVIGGAAPKSASVALARRPSRTGGEPVVQAGQAQSGSSGAGEQALHAGGR